MSYCDSCSDLYRECQWLQADIAGADQSIHEGQCLTVLQGKACPWGQAAANHRARQPVEGRDFERMP